jgi:hypothetical protein
MRMKLGIRDTTKRWALALGPWVIVLAGLTACTGQQASAPQAAVPAPTERSREATPAGSPVGRALASPVARAATSPVALVSASPIALASCEDYAAWTSDPDVRASLEKTALWPEVIAEAEKAANGEPVDREHARRLFDQLARVARPLRESDVAEANPETAQRAARAMGLSARLAESLGRNQFDQTTASAGLAELKQAIADYEGQVAAEEARCS